MMIALEYAIKLIENPDAFLSKIRYLYSHPKETSRDELEFRSGMVLDRYSSPSSIRADAVTEESGLSATSPIANGLRTSSSNSRWQWSRAPSRW